MEYLVPLLLLEIHRFASKQIALGLFVLQIRQCNRIQLGHHTIPMEGL